MKKVTSGGESKQEALEAKSVYEILCLVVNWYDENSSDDKLSPDEAKLAIKKLVMEALPDKKTEWFHCDGDACYNDCLEDVRKSLEELFHG